MSKNISIKEGGVSRTFTANKLRTNLQGGGTCDWVPKDDVDEYVELEELSVTENGIYYPTQKVGISKVVVDVEGGGGGGGGEEKLYEYAWTALNITQGSYVPTFASFTPSNAVVYNGRIHLFGQKDTASTLHVSWGDSDGFRVESTLPISTFTSKFVADDHYIHLLGGSGNTTAHYVWDGSVWRSAEYPLAFPINTQTLSPNQIVYVNGFVYVIGGYSSANKNYVHVMDINPNTENSVSDYEFPFTLTETYMVCDAAAYGSSIIMAGFITTDSARNCYSFSDGTFIKMDDIPWLARDRGGTLLEYDGKLHYFGGSNTASSSIGIRSYYPSKHKWLDCGIYPSFITSDFGGAVPSSTNLGIIIPSFSRSSGLNAIVYNNVIHVIGINTSSMSIVGQGHWTVEKRLIT